ncbi:MAG TPA: trypsin-like peptidase domain-containing protein, partial [Anaerolinea sp.]|nr:trypsin-like peptidase domain-containing protein [Anaerolinea sp.]
MINKKTSLISSIVLVLAMIVLPACNGVPVLTAGNVNSNAPSAQSTPVAQADTQNPSQAQSQPAQVTTDASGVIAAYQGDLQDIYTRVNPSIVAIHVVSPASASSSNPLSQQGNTPQVQEALGSGFVWDTQGHIITNNHVVSGAQKIDVTFSDGTNVPATLVGADPDSDLAVIKVDVSTDMLHPVTLADSTQVKVGQLAIALGNPFGLENTMTVGIVSALGRSLPANENASSSSGPTYTIPDIIQTDAPINPGNSGGVLLDANGQVIGVTAAIESPSQANAGIGLVIPSQIVGKVVPALIKDGKFVHPWLGISGASLNLDLATAMKLTPTQRGVLVATVTPNSPASKAGILSGDLIAKLD